MGVAWAEGSDEDRGVGSMEALTMGAGAGSVVGRATTGPWTHDSASHSCCPGPVIHSTPLSPSKVTWFEQ